MGGGGVSVPPIQYSLGIMRKKYPIQVRLQLSCFLGIAALTGGVEDVEDFYREGADSGRQKILLIVGRDLVSQVKFNIPIQLLRWSLAPTTENFFQLSKIIDQSSACRWGFHWLRKT